MCAERAILCYIICRKSIGYKALVNPEIPDGEEKRVEEQAKIDSAAALTEEESLEKEALLTQGFGDWTKKDFTQFIKLCAEYGREDIDAISAEIEGKTRAQVAEYVDIFWERKEELTDHDRIITTIERGESRIQRRKEIIETLSLKMTRYRAPFYQLKINYYSGKSRNYTEDEDRYLLCMLYKLGFHRESVYDDLRLAVRNAGQFRFDWFIKSRTASELQRRCNTLISLVERENQELEEDEKRKKKSKRKLDTSTNNLSKNKKHKVY